MPASTTDIQPGQVNAIALTDDERALARRLPDKVVYVAIVDFRGPRGRNYRPIRSDAKVSEASALAQAETIRNKRYRNNARPTATTLFMVDPLGNVLAAEVR